MKKVKLPAHIAFIMDGNGRWARRRFRPRGYGHKMGVQNMFKVCAHCFHLGNRNGVRALVGKFKTSQR